MTALIILGFLVATLFVLAYTTKRRFGVLGLALLAGSYLAATWTDTVTPAVEQAGLVVAAPPLTTIVAFGLTLLPALVLFINSPVYHAKRSKLIGSIIFSLFAVVLLIQPLGNALIIDGTAQTVFSWVEANYALLVTGGLVAAIADLFLAKTKLGRR